MKIYAIADLHLPFSTNKPMEIFGKAWDGYLEKIKTDWKSKVKQEDIVLVPGDISWAMKLSDFQKDLAFFDDLPGKIILSKGNHDYWWSSKTKVRAVLPDNMFVLQSDAIKFGNVAFCGTRGWDIVSKNSSDTDKKIFARELIRLELALKDGQALQTEKGDKLVLLLHFPPYLANNKNTEFVKLITKYKVDAVVFGHLHSDSMGLKLQEEINGTKYYLTSCDLVQNTLVEISP